MRARDHLTTGEYAQGNREGMITMSQPMFYHHTMLFEQ